MLYEIRMKNNRARRPPVVALGFILLSLSTWKAEGCCCSRSRSTPTGFNFAFSLRVSGRPFRMRPRRIPLPVRRPATNLIPSPHRRLIPSSARRMKPNNFGNIRKVNPTGASASTAKSDDLTCSGNHKYMVCCTMKACGLLTLPYLQDFCLLHDVLGVGASRQIAKNDLNRIKKYDPDIKISAKEYEMDAAVLAGTISFDHWWSFFTGAHQAVLADNLEKVKAKHTDWSPEQQLQVSIAAYNYGPGNVRTWENLDIGTTSNDYSNDVMARARFYRENGFING
ncbi:unnamed protein product [Clavelina lepadiformis]|uniref:Lysozyme g n=1 Tax=Clavelina lepadiformis TaxID=159417 RepID=A0ABP0GJ45_CLALP